MLRSTDYLLGYYSISTCFRPNELPVGLVIKTIWIISND